MRYSLSVTVRQRWTPEHANSRRQKLRHCLDARSMDYSNDSRAVVVVPSVHAPIPNFLATPNSRRSRQHRRMAVAEGYLPTLAAVPIRPLPGPALPAVDRGRRSPPVATRHRDHRAANERIDIDPAAPSAPAALSTLAVFVVLALLAAFLHLTEMRLAPLIARPRSASIG